MGLVDYSDSEGSETDVVSTTAEMKSKSASSKANFQKVVDRSNPHKIRVTLPQAPNGGLKEDEVPDEPSAKRVRTGGGALSGFNSFLPAPKRNAPTGSQTMAASRKGLGSGVNLKTGAAPGFSRNLDIGDTHYNHETVAENGEASLGENSVKGTSKMLESDSAASKLPSIEPKKTGTPMMFKPLSVARKTPKKKSTVASTSRPLQASIVEVGKEPETVPKVSLFSMGAENSSTSGSITSTSEDYKPMILEQPQPDAENILYPPGGEQDYKYSNPRIVSPAIYAAEQPTEQETQSLDTIAADLNLSISARRQLFGRQGSSAASAANIVNFNTDQEYAANEALRAAGETVQHNPVKAIAPGKHNLKQLVNAASNQKDALEEHFASGKRNKKEAGSKYGW